MMIGDPGYQIVKLNPFEHPREKNNASNETSHPSTIRSNIMTESTSQTAPAETTVVNLTDASAPEPNRLQKFIIKHPKTTRVVAIAGVVATVAGVVLMVANKQTDASDDASGSDLSLEELQEMSKSDALTGTDN